MIASPRIRGGVVYTIVSFLLLIVIGTIFLTNVRRDTHDQFLAVEDRVRTMDAFLDDLESDSARAAYIAGFRSLIALEQYIASTGDYLADPSLAFMEMFVNGTYNGTSFTILDNATFNDYLARVQTQALRQGMLCNLTVVNITLWQWDPWTLLVNYTIDIDLVDVRGTASWETRRTMRGEVPFVDIRDPLFTGNTFARVQRVIRPTTISVFVDDAGDANDTSGLQTHFNTSLYIARGRGPSVLMRFANNTSDSVYGIESLVDTQELLAQGLSVDAAATVVDYAYFNGTPATACNIQELPAWLVLADADLTVYDIDGKLTYGSC